MVETFAKALLAAEAETLCDADCRARSAERVNSRAGYRPQARDTGAGMFELAVLKLRSGSRLPD